MRQIAANTENMLDDNMKHIKHVSLQIFASHEL